MNLAATPSPIKKGRNDFTIPVDGASREYIVYVPSGYNPSNPSPVVFMFHGTGGDGEKFYNISGWKETAEKENFLAVFPSALPYFIVDKGRKQTKWTSSNLGSLVPPGTKLKDDVRFVAGMLAKLNKDFSIDKKRIYASGFSNGAGFVLSRIATELSNQFAAVSAVGGIMPHVLPVSGDQISCYSMMGEIDDNIMENRGGDPLPLTQADFLADAFMQDRMSAALGTFNLSTTPTNFMEKPNHLTNHYDQALGGNDNEFILSIVRGLEHRYPNPRNNPHGFIAAKKFWQFFKRHSK